MKNSFHLLFVLAVFWQQYGQVVGECCEIKVVEDDDLSKNGTYILLMATDTAPDFCIGGCVYKKKDDDNPNNMYCFKDGPMLTTCGAGGIGGAGVTPVIDGRYCVKLEDMMKTVVEKMDHMHCRPTPNLVIKLETFGEELDKCETNCYYSRVPISDVNLSLYENGNCEGVPVNTGVSREARWFSCWDGGEFYFFLSIFEYKDWSILAEKDGYYPKCENIGPKLPRSYLDYDSITLQPLASGDGPGCILSLNATWTATPGLMPDMRMQSNPYFCYNDTYFAEMYGPGYGGCRGSGGSGSGSFFRDGKSNEEGPNVTLDEEGNILNATKNDKKDPKSYYFKDCRCSPQCNYVTWNLDYDQPCDCRAVEAGGLHFDEISYSETITPFEFGNMIGSMVWMNYSNPDMKYYTMFAEFTRKGDEINSVCTSSFTFYFSDCDGNSIPGYGVDVPCIPPQIRPDHGILIGSGIGSLLPGPIFPSLEISDFFGSGFGSGMGSGSGIGPIWPSIDQCLDEFQEVDGSLVYGQSDRYWIASCMVDSDLSTFIKIPGLFSYKAPKESPGLCGCLYSIPRIMNGGNPTNEEVKQCYCEALYMEGMDDIFYPTKNSEENDGNIKGKKGKKEKEEDIDREFKDKWSRKKKESHNEDKKPKPSKDKQSNESVEKKVKREVSDYDTLDYGSGF